MANMFIYSKYFTFLMTSMRGATLSWVVFFTTLSVSMLSACNSVGSSLMDEQPDVAFDGAVADTPDGSSLSDGSALDARLEDGGASGLTDAALMSCDEQFGSAPGFVLCGENDRSCTFEAVTEGSCRSLCERYGAACVSAFDNPEADSRSCMPAEEDGCDRERVDEICVCGREPLPTRSELDVRFAALPTTGAAPLHVQFEDLSVGNDVDRWEWDLGDGTLSGLQDPAHSYYVPGDYSVSLTAYDRDGFATAVMTGLVRVGAYVTSPRHIDPGNVDDTIQDGTLAHPYGRWADVTFEAGGVYLQKRGTVAHETVQVAVSGREDEHITIGAYGVGDPPVLDGSDLGMRRGFRIGQYRAGPIVAYVDVSDFEVRNFSGSGVVSEPHEGHSPHHCTFTNLHIHHNGTRGGNYPGMYLWPTVRAWDDPLHNTVTNCRSNNNAEHGFKIASGSSVIDRSISHDNRAHGVSYPLEAHDQLAVQVTAYNNGTSGIELGGRRTSAVGAICYGNRWGIMALENETHRIVQALLYDNTREGLFVACEVLDPPTANIFITESVIRNNQGGILFRNGCRAMSVERSSIHHNTAFGIRVARSGGSPANRGFSSHNNLIYENEVGLDLSSVDGVDVVHTTLHNTIDLTVAGSVNDVTVRNSFLQTSTGNYDQDHNVDDLSAADFVDIERGDYHLLRDSICVDAGAVDVDIPNDLDGTLRDGDPDVGAFEWQAE